MAHHLKGVQPDGEMWNKLKEYMSKYLDAADFRPQWKAVTNGHLITKSVLTPKAILNAFEIAGISTYEGRKRVQAGVTTDASDADIILSKDPRYKTDVTSEESLVLKRDIKPSLTELYRQRGWVKEGNE
jgi:hypothetical protein